MTKLVYHLLSSLQASYSANAEIIDIRYSKTVLNLLRIFQEYKIIDFFLFTGKQLKPNRCRVFLTLRNYIEKDKYSWSYLKPYTKLKIQSRPGLRFFLSYKQLQKEPVHLHLYILSTTKGLITGKEALAHKIGGELICVFFI